MSSQVVLNPPASSIVDLLMSSTPFFFVTNISPTVIDTKNIQGDVVLGLQKRVEAFVLITLKDDPDSQLNFRQQLKSKLLPLITTTQDVMNTQRKIEESRGNKKIDGSKNLLPITQVNVAFSAKGLKKLGLTSGEIPSGPFNASQKSDAFNLGDPIDSQTQKLSTWSNDFLNNTIDGVILITAPDSTLLNGKVDEINEIVQSSISNQFILHGSVRPDPEAGHEHFGFLDCISTPKIEGFNSTDADKQSGIVKPSVILSGQADTWPLPDPQLWMKDGSFMALRQLQQLVPEFQKFCDDTAAKNPTVGVTGEFIGARIVGRWKSGAPITLAPIEDDSELTGAQNFDYSDELEQQRCPYAAHIRKTNPRKGLGPKPPIPVLPRLMVRSGIPYGPEVTPEEMKSNRTSENRGLLFVSYQSAIESGFRFVQQTWCNNSAFPPNNPARVTAGSDLLIGQTLDSAPRTAQNIMSDGVSGDSNPDNITTADIEFIKPLGGEYFFSPSIEAIKTKLGA